MNDASWIFGLSWVLTQATSLLMLTIGSRFAGQRHLLHLGEIAHRRKLRALATLWPLTKVRPAANRGDLRTCTVVLSALIGLKSLGCLVLGVVMVFWLPVASLFVPAMVAVHDPDDPSLGPWVKKVATLQVTSHALAAALGFAILVAGPVNGRSVGTAIQSNALLFVLVSVGSLALAVAAGRLEAAGVVERGI